MKTFEQREIRYIIETTRKIKYLLSYFYYQCFSSVESVDKKQYRSTKK